MKKIILLGLVLSSALLLRAQNRKLSRDSSTVIIFNQHSSSGGERAPHKRSGENNVVKIAPLGFISGAFPLAFEKKITDFFSVQVSAGLTHKNYVRGAFQKQGGDDETQIKYKYPWADDVDAYNDDLTQPAFNYDYRTPKMGYMYNIQPRFYYEDDALDGNYVALCYDVARYNFETPGVVKKGDGSTSQTGSLQQEHEKITDLMVHFGRQAVYDRLTMDFSVGIGMRNVKGEKYAATTRGSDLLTGMATYKQSVLNFGISFRLGYHF